SMRAWATDPRMSCLYSRRSKASDEVKPSAVLSAGLVKRPPQSLVMARGLLVIQISHDYTILRIFMQPGVEKAAGRQARPSAFHSAAAQGEAPFQLGTARRPQVAAGQRKQLGLHRAQRRRIRQVRRRLHFDVVV